MICVTLRGPDIKAKLGHTSITDWDRLRKKAEAEDDEAEETDDEVKTYQAWAEKQRELVKKYTQKIATTTQVPFVDSRLAHMWEARHGLTRRCKRQRHNKKLRKRIYELNKQAAEYAIQLCRENWMKICDGLQGTLSTKKTWKLLRHLIDPLKSKSAGARDLARTINSYDGDEEKLIRELTRKYLNTEKSGEPTLGYEGASNEDMDAAFTELELIAAIDESNQGSAPGIDDITYKVLRNMSDKSRTELLDLANAAWKKGSLPKEWKEAEVHFIPKPGKPPHIDNLRPISLTSCVGKVVERMVFKRLQRHLDTTHQMPPTMYGFRGCLSTHDVLVQIHELVIKKAKNPTPRAILALDLKGAFDHVTHDSILRNLRDTGCGERTFKYVRDFLSNRTAKIKIGDEKSQPIALGDRGTPQGSVLSPLLFNLALLPLPALLQGIEGIDHALYADDITVWTSRAGSESWMEETLQRAAETVHDYAKSCGLGCSPQKSELLIIKPRRKKGEQEKVRITIDGTNITPTTQARILGVIFQNNGKAAAALSKIKTTTEQITNMIRRVTNRRRGLKEDDALTLVQAFVTSRIVYAAPYLQLLKRDRDHLNTIIRKATKMALGIPCHSSTEKLLGMAKHNTVEELVEAHLSNQRVRLSQTAAGRLVLTKLGWQEADHKETGPLPKLWAQKIQTKPLPRNMRPGRNDGRRAARVKALIETLRPAGEEEEDATGVTLYTDASLPKFSTRATISVTTKDALVTCASVKTAFPEEAEEAAIAVALTQPEVNKIITDSQKAYANYRKGRVSLTALRILEGGKLRIPEQKIELIWTPAHSGLEGNELAHQLARELEHRADEHEPQAITSYKDITSHYREGRRRYPEPHKSLSRAQQTILRQVQAGSFPHPYLQSRMYPERYKKECSFCGQLGTLRHVIGECDFTKTTPPPLTQPSTTLPTSLNERWETLLTSPALEVQLVLISRGQAAAEAYGSREEGTTPSGT